ncbi:MAG: CPBP family glutamic-type intramembrane protease [Promethearchaeota archaeon]
MSEKSQRTCPGCGLLIKVNETIEECPMCGEKLDSLPPPKKEKEELKSLMKTLYNREKGSKKYNVRELMNVTFISFFLTSLVRFIFFSAVQSFYSEEGEPVEIPFNPAIYFFSNALIAVIGLYPIIYMKLRGDGYAVFGLGRIKRKELAMMIIVGAVAGFGLYFIDLFSQVINNQIYDVTGWDFWDNSNPEFSTYLSDSIWNRLIMSIGFILSASIPEILLRGVIQKKLMEIYITEGKSTRGEVKSFLLSFVITSGISFAIFLTPLVIVFSLLSNLLLTAIYRFTRSVYACIVVQAMYIIIAMFILF